MYDDALRKKLKNLRCELGLTQKQLADALSVSVSTLSHWECGYQEPSAKDIVRLAVIFEVSTDYLLGLESVGGIVVNKSALSLSKDEIEILELYKALSPSRREDCRLYLRALSGATGANMNTRKNA